MFFWRKMKLKCRYHTICKFYFSSDSIGVKKKSDAEALWQKTLTTKLCVCVCVQTEWDSFLENVDTGLQTTHTGTRMGDSLSPDTRFTDVRSGKGVTLGQYLGRDHVAELEADFEARSLRVLVVCFGRREGAELWLQQTGCSFDMLLDPQSQTYRTLGLGSSYAKVIKFSFLLNYSEYKTVEICPYFVQMGGNFVLDEAGKVLLSHPSKTPLDRPTVDDVLEAVDAADSRSL
uniref:Uncharacterized protein n=1 Tax=Cynoglossus semilaevis TaxID=244447 RepID=A0A3P8UVT2_CYNSE